LERSKIAYERSKTVEKQAELDLERNVYTAITNAKVALNAYEVGATTAFEARKEAFNYAKEKYAVGMMNSFDLQSITNVICQFTIRSFKNEIRLYF
jgi:outer membrane protein